MAKQIGKRKMVFDAFNVKRDNWVNLMVGLSGTSDKTSGTYFGTVPLLDDEELSRVWTGAGLGKKIVSVVADDMTRNWFTINEDTDGAILKELTTIDAETEVNIASKWARHYGGSIIVMGLDDGRKLSEPLAKTINGINWLKTYSRSRISVMPTDIVSDPKSPYFEDIEWFNIQKRNGHRIKVHHSRCMVFKGEPVPDTGALLTTNFLYWGMSALQSVWNALTNYGGISQSVVNLMYEAVIGKLKLHNLGQVLSGGNKEKVYERLEIINYSKSNINMMVLDEKDDFIRDSANMTGIPPMMDRFMMNLSAETEIPVTLLFGRSPAGENATGESDLRKYYDMIKSKQKTWLTPPLQTLVNHINSYLKVVPDKPVIKYNGIWEPTQEEMVNMQNKQADTDIKYISSGVLNPVEVTESRFGGGEYSFDTKLIEGSEREPIREELEEEPEEEVE